MNLQTPRNRGIMILGLYVMTFSVQTPTHLDQTISLCMDD